MKQLLFFSCALAMLSAPAIHAMDAGTLKDQIETHQWGAIATALANNTISAAQLAPYPKEAFDRKNQESRDLFTTLIRATCQNLTYGNYGFKNTDKSQRIWKAIELLIFMEKITHDETIVTNNILNPYNNFNSATIREEISRRCIDWYTQCIQNVHNHKTTINTCAANASWNTLVSHMYTQKADPLYLMELTGEQQTALQAELTRQSAIESCTERKKFLTALNDQLPHIPHRAVNPSGSNTQISFARAYRSYLVGGFAFMAVVALGYRYYRSSQVDDHEADAVDDTDTMPQALI